MSDDRERSLEFEADTDAGIECPIKPTITPVGHRRQEVLEQSRRRSRYLRRQLKDERDFRAQLETPDGEVPADELTHPYQDLLEDLMASTGDYNQAAADAIRDLRSR